MSNRSIVVSEESWQNIIMSDLDLSNYQKIRLNSLHPQRSVPFDVFVMVAGRIVHYLRAGDKMTQEKIDKFERTAPDSFLILKTDKQNYKNYIHSHLIGEDLNSKEKALMLRESSLALVEEIFENPDVSEALKESRQLIDEFINFMDQDPEAMGYLIGLSSHDFYTYNHSLDVGVYSLGLGLAAGFSGKDLKELGEGALFHDIGKRNVSVDIICKNGPLDDVEWAQMQKHPQFGLMILEEQDVSEAVKACCFEHHESFLGNGYPQQLEGDEIHPMARIVAITDTYDAMTTKRSYSDPMTPGDALNFMKNKLAGRYDNDLLDAMYSALFKMKI